MNKKMLFTGALISLCSASLWAQAPNFSQPKWDLNVERLLQQQSAKHTRGAAEEITSLTVSCHDAKALAETLRQAGYKATAICADLVSAQVPLSYIQQLAEVDGVRRINGPQKVHASMHDVRRATHADQVQMGTGLETPFTGKGVIVGVIDQGFEYKHIAFLDKEKQPRALAVWNHFSNMKPTELIPSTGDMISGTGGHATHVTNIAAGSKVQGNNFYGIAPDADIIMIPSTFQDPDILSEASYIQSIAEREQKPFVINMSFGTQMGPHDGTTDHCRAMDSISEQGGILVAAMGNEGMDILHTQHTFTKPNEKVYFLLKNVNGADQIWLDFWGQNADGQQHFKVRPVLHYDVSGRIDPKTEDFFTQKNGFWGGGVEDFNKKEHYVGVFTSSVKPMRTHFAIEVEGNPGDSFHAWVEANTGEIGFPDKTQGETYLEGDNEWCTSEAAAIIPSAISVAAYNANHGGFTSVADGKVYGYGADFVGVEGQIAPFSSRGPGLGATKQPWVAAPGCVVNSAVSKYGQDFNKKDEGITSIIYDKNNQYYYAVMNGTSMATPVVTGIVALWLQANPQLTYKDVKQIIRETAFHDVHTGKQEWTNSRGYGKIDAYAGLKKALEMAEATGINDQLNSETPLTLQHKGNALQVLFNNDESYADIVIYNASGAAVKRQQLQGIRRGQDLTVTAADLPSGVYVVRIHTTSSTVAKKILVK